MKSNAKPSRCPWSLFSAVLLTLAAFSVPMHGQEAANTVGYSEDWSSHHVVFSNPGTEADAVQSGKYGEWLKITGEPRYQMQQAKRNAPAVQPTLVAPASNRLNFGRSGSGQLSPIENGGIRRIGGRPVAGPEFGKGRLGVTIDKDWSMSIGTAPSATLTFTVSNNPGVGTVTGGTSTLAISGPAGFTTQTLTASAPVAAKQTGTFSTAPTSTLSTISVTVGSNNLTLNTDATAASATANISAIPTSAGSAALSIVNNDGTINMTPTGATALTGTVTFSAVPTSASSNALTITNSVGTVNMAPTGASAGSAGTVTVSAVPTTAASNAITIANANGTVNMAPTGASALTGTVTVAAEPTSASTNALTVVNSVGTVNMAPTGATAASSTATFSTAGSTSTTATIANGVTAGVVLTGATGEATVSEIVVAFTGTSTSTTLTIGGVTYTFAATCTTGNCIVTSGTASTAAANIVAAIDNTCTTNCHVTAVNPQVSAGASTNGGSGTRDIPITNQYYQAVGSNSGSAGLTVTATLPQTTLDGCSSATAGNFVVGTTANASALNLYEALVSTSCQTTHPIGVSSSSTTNPGGTSASFTVADSALGFASFTGASGLSFSAISGGSNGTGNACTTPASGTFLLAPASTVPTTATTATALRAALAACSSSGITEGTVAGSAFTLTDSVLGFATFTPLSGITTVTASSGGSNGTANSCTTPASGTFLLAPASTLPTTSTVATALRTALAACSTSGISVGTVSTNTFTLTDTALGYATFTPLSGITTVTNTSGGSNGTANSCATPASGTFLLAPATTVPTTSTAATALQAALAACSTPGFTEGAVTTNHFTVTDSVLGFATFTPLSGITTLTGSSGGSNGTANSCTTPASGTFLLAGASTVPTTSTVTSGLQTALAACPASAGISAGAVSGLTIPVTDNVLGAATFTGSTGLSWTGVTAGNNGSFSCSGSAPTFTATYASGTTATLASNLSSAINSCNAATLGVASTYTSGNSFSLADATAGTGGNSGTALSPTGAGYFAWTSGSLTGGSDGTTSGTAFKYWTTNAYDTEAQLATDLAASLNVNATVTGALTVSANTNQVTLTAKTGGATGNSYAAANGAFSALSGTGNLAGGVDSTVNPNTYPAKYSFSTTTASCSDYVIYPTGFGGGQATIVGYNNLYATTCASPGPVPNIAFAYNTGGTAGLSPIFSLDGTQIAFVQTNSLNQAELVIMKPSLTSGGTVGTPATDIGSAVGNGSYHNCPAPCYTTITFSGSANDTNSSPYYDYNTAGGDILWVGDDAGKLHEFTGVFNGTSPAENLSNWPVTVDSGTKLSSPVWDSISGNVFVTDSVGKLSKVTTPGTPVVTNSAAIPAGGAPLNDAPILDEMPASPLLYVTMGDCCNGTAHTDVGVERFTEALTADGYDYVTGGGGSTTLTTYAGSFDNIHYDIAGGAGGFFVVCLPNGGTPGLYHLPLASGWSTSGTTVTVSDTIGTAATCSPVTEFLGAKANTTLSAAMTNAQTTVSVGSTAGMAVGDYIQIDSEIMHIVTPLANPLNVTRAQQGTAAVAHNTVGDAVQDIQDWAYLSVSAGGGDASCSGACLYNYNITTTTAPTNATTGIATTGGASGVIVDNALTGTGESQIYYASQGNEACAGNGTTGNSTGATCAVQTSQSNP